MSDYGETVDQRLLRDGDATVDQRATRPLRGRLRTILPDQLLSRYVAQQNLDVSAGQADLVLALDRPTGEQVVIKLYRQAEQLDREVLQKLYAANPSHVVRLIDHGDSDGEPWEVQEYCAHGTLTDLRLAHGGRLSEDLAIEVLRELADAIEHIHSLGITHRDLKPENVLVRSLKPLDLVLTDFGVAAEQIVTVQLQTVAASWAWAAPEVHTKGAVSRGIDWWALGAIMHQVLTGRHPLAGPDGRLPADSKLVRAGVVDGLLATDTIDSSRWRLLVEGLLTYHPDSRWAFTEVSAWLRGESPPLRGGLGPDTSRARPVTRFTVSWSPVMIEEPRGLAALIRAHEDEFLTLLGKKPNPKLVAFLQQFPATEMAVAVLESGGTPSAKATQLLALLDPDGPILFRGREIAGQGLPNMVAWALHGDQEAASWLRALVDESILRVFAEVTGSERARSADFEIGRWRAQAEEASTGLPAEFSGVVQQAMDDALPELLMAALAPSSSGELVRSARALSTSDLGSDKWAQRLRMSVTSAADDDLGLLVVARAVLGIQVERVAQVKRIEAERQRAEKEAARVIAERRRREQEDRRREEEERQRRESDQRRKREIAARTWWPDTVADAERKDRDSLERQADALAESTRSELGKLLSEFEKARTPLWISNRQIIEAFGTEGVFWWIPAGLSFFLWTQVPGSWAWAGDVFYNFGPFALIFFILLIIAATFVTAWFIALGLNLLRVVLYAPWVRLGEGRRYAAEVAAASRKVQEAKSRQLRLVLIPESRIGAVIGKGGATVRDIESTSGARVSVETWKATFQSSYGRVGRSLADRRIVEVPCELPEVTGSTIGVVRIQAGNARSIESAERAIRALI